MSRIDPECFSQPSEDDPVCAKCFDDDDIAEWIEDFDGPPGCNYCGKKDAPTAPLSDLAEYMRSCLASYYSLAVENLPYESAEGGYQGTTWTTYELLFEEVGLGFPRDKGDRLMSKLPDMIEEQEWCEYDWLALDYDEELDFEWKRFCEFIKHQRRFFFALREAGKQAPGQKEEWSPRELLTEILGLAERFKLVRTIEAKSKYYRARPRTDQAFETAAELGPPPEDFATQSNRMNPPGIPMMYVSDSFDTAVAEVRSPRVSVGQFELTRDIRLLDLYDLPSVPGIFSNADRKVRLGLSFLWGFSRAISKPVERSDRTHVDYIPSQVVTEFIRDSKIDKKKVDGIIYRSAIDKKGSNIVLFATRNDLEEADGEPVCTESWRKPNPWLRITKVWPDTKPKSKNSPSDLTR